jgi:hypothetical protein
MRKSILFSIVFVLSFSLAGIANAKSTTLTFIGTGLITKVTLNDPHCGYLPQGCQANIRGNWFVSNFGSGKFNADLRTAWQNSVPNGRGGYCAPITGTAIAEPNGKHNQLFISISGQACDRSISSEILPHTYVGQFVITGGTGEYKNVTGSGNFNGIDNGRNKAFFTTKGEITNP